MLMYVLHYAMDVEQNSPATCWHLSGSGVHTQCDQILQHTVIPQAMVVSGGGPQHLQCAVHVSQGYIRLFSQQHSHASPADHLTAQAARVQARAASADLVTGPATAALVMAEMNGQQQSTPALPAAVGKLAPRPGALDGFIASPYMLDASLHLGAVLACPSAGRQAEARVPVGMEAFAATAAYAPDDVALWSSCEVQSVDQDGAAISSFKIAHGKLQQPAAASITLSQLKVGQVDELFTWSASNQQFPVLHYKIVQTAGSAN